MKVLVACEESQVVCKAFRARGHEAYSCDIQECSGGHPEWHIHSDCLRLINGNATFLTQDGEKHFISGPWDLIIAHPPCTYLSNAGARWLFAGGTLNKKRFQMGLRAKKFFLEFLNCNCKRVAIENPIPSSIFELSERTQIIQPYQFGHPYSKKTCLWLRGLPPLKPTDIRKVYRPYITSGTYSKTHDPKYKGASRRGGSAKSRSKTFFGIANAMAEQWG